MIVGADKSSNFFYKMQSETYSDLLEKAVHKNLKKAKEGEKEEITKVDKTTAIGLSISDRVFQTEMKKAKVTIKDHKADFLKKLNLASNYWKSSFAFFQPKQSSLLG